MTFVSSSCTSPKVPSLSSAVVLKKNHPKKPRVTALNSCRTFFSSEKKRRIRRVMFRTACSTEHRFNPGNTDKGLGGGEPFPKRNPVTIMYLYHSTVQYRLSYLLLNLFDSRPLYPPYCTYPKYSTGTHPTIGNQIKNQNLLITENIDTFHCCVSGAINKLMAICRCGSSVEVGRCRFSEAHVPRSWNCTGVSCPIQRCDSLHRFVRGIILRTTVHIHIYMYTP